MKIWLDDEGMARVYDPPTMTVRACTRDEAHALAVVRTRTPRIPPSVLADLLLVSRSRI